MVSDRWSAIDSTLRAAPPPGIRAVAGLCCALATVAMLSVLTGNPRVPAATPAPPVYMLALHPVTTPLAQPIRESRAARRAVNRTGRDVHVEGMPQIAQADRSEPAFRMAPPPEPTLRVDVRAALRAQQPADRLEDLGIPRENVMGPREPSVLDRQTKLGRDIERARRPDCRHAYSGGGLLAIPFLAYDTLTDTGCKW